MAKSFASTLEAELSRGSQWSMKEATTGNLSST